MTEYQLLQLLLRGSKLKVVHEECQFSNAGNNELPCFNYWMFLLLIYQYDLLVFRILLFTAKQKWPISCDATNLWATPSSTVLKGKRSNYSFQTCQAKFYRQHLLQNLEVGRRRCSLSLWMSKNITWSSKISPKGKARSLTSFYKS